MLPRVEGVLWLLPRSLPMSFAPEDYGAYVVGLPDRGRWVVVRIRGSEYGLDLDEAEYLFDHFKKAFIRACDPTELPPPAPVTPAPQRLTSKPSRRTPTLDDL